MQWVAVYNDSGGNKHFIHQYPEGLINGESRATNIKEVYELQEQKKLIAICFIPVNKRFDDYTQPRFYVSMLDGSFHINSLEFDLRPEYMQQMDPQPFYEFEEWREVKEAHGPEGYPQHVSVYKIGWKCTIGEETVTRMLIYNIRENTVTFRNYR
jgi:hypothetical protein